MRKLYLLMAFAFASSVVGCGDNPSTEPALVDPATGRRGRKRGLGADRRGTPRPPRGPAVKRRDFLGAAAGTGRRPPRPAAPAGRRPRPSSSSAPTPSAGITCAKGHGAKDQSTRPSTPRSRSSAAARPAAPPPGACGGPASPTSTCSSSRTTSAAPPAAASCRARVTRSAPTTCRPRRPAAPRSSACSPTSASSSAATPAAAPSTRPRRSPPRRSSATSAAAAGTRASTPRPARPPTRPPSGPAGTPTCASLDGRRGSDGRPLFAIPVASQQRRAAPPRRASRSPPTSTDLGLVSDRLRWALDYACRDDYGCTLAQTSAFAGLHHFLARGLEETRGGFLLTWPEGNARLVRGMLERADLGDRLHRGAAVVAVDPAAGELRVHRPGDGRRLRVHATGDLVGRPALRPQPPARRRRPAARRRADVRPVAGRQRRRTHRPAGHRRPPRRGTTSRSPAPASATSSPPTASPPTHAAPARSSPTTSRCCGDGPAELAAQRQRLLSADLSTLVRPRRGCLAAMHPGIASEISSIADHPLGARHDPPRPRPAVRRVELARARAPLGRLRPCAADVAGLPAVRGGVLSGLQRRSGRPRRPRPRATPTPSPTSFA